MQHCINTLLQRYLEPIETKYDQMLRASQDDCKHTRELYVLFQSCSHNPSSTHQIRYQVFLPNLSSHLAPWQTRVMITWSELQALRRRALS